jgi:phage terminase Nu1 subunit (DNA packaging protein)
MSITQLSELTGRDRRTVSKRLESLPVHSEDGRAKYYDVTKALPLIYNDLATIGIERKLQEEQLRFETGRADKMELDVQKRRGELVEINQVSEVVQTEYARVRAGLLAIPNKMAHVLAIVDTPAEIKSKLEDAVNEALSELSVNTEAELASFDVTKTNDGNESTEEIDARSSESSQATSKVKPS